MKILITGARGQLGWELQKIFPRENLILTDKEELDFTDRQLTLNFFKETRPDICIHAGAYTAVDKAQSEPEMAQMVNCEGSRNIAQAAKNSGAKLIAISTDYVFGGEKKRPYKENDPTNPQSVYGKSKLAGEQAIFARLKQAIVLRTAWLYGGRSVTGASDSYPNPLAGVFKNFPNTMLALAYKGKPLRVVDDQFGCPTYARHLAKAIKKIITKRIPPGIYHATNRGRASWFEFAQAVLRERGLKCPLSATSSASYSTPAPRPQSSVLSGQKLAKLGIVFPVWKAGIREFLQEA